MVEKVINQIQYLSVEFYSLSNNHSFIVNLFVQFSSKKEERSWLDYSTAVLVSLCVIIWFT